MSFRFGQEPVSPRNITLFSDAIYPFPQVTLLRRYPPGIELSPLDPPQLHQLRKLCHWQRMLKSLANLQRYYWTHFWSTAPSILSYSEVCSELSADLANIVEEEHHILDNPITSPPTSFPTKLHRLDRLNLTAQTDIIQAKGALEEYLDTV